MADEHECGVCGTTFDDEDQLNEHIEAEHSDADKQ